MKLVGISNKTFTGLFSNNGVVLLGTFVYVKCNEVDRKDLWDHLNGISGVGVPWMVLGDFNIIRVDDEHIGGRLRPLCAMAEFHDCINTCGLIDLRLHGRQMSWCNGQSGLA
ncbi:hypothetical protein I3760_05G020100 [Carya illinoinensis]|nr:hypothetical protein I3760_05G020100 [Carya illinoinensis]